ncbi:hypothetical protein H8958_013754 [Nasalis larvatus]
MKTHFLVPFLVNYVGKCIRTVPYTDPDHARDPNTIETLQSCGKAVYWAKSGKFTQQDIDEAKLSVFSTIDAPVAPSDKGMDHFLYGLSDEMKQAHREQLFTVSHDKLLAVSDRYLSTGKSMHGLAILRPKNPKIAKDPSWIIR